MASGERFLSVSAPSQSTGPPQKPQETCHSARQLVRRRVWPVCELAERSSPGMNGLCRGWSRNICANAPQTNCSSRPTFSKARLTWCRTPGVERIAGAKIAPSVTTSGEQADAATRALVVPVADLAAYAPCLATITYHHNPTRLLVAANIRPSEEQEYFGPPITIEVMHAVEKVP